MKILKKILFCLILIILIFPNISFGDDYSYNDDIEEIDISEVSSSSRRRTYNKFKTHCCH